MTELPDLLTIPQAAAVLGISRGALYRRIEHGDIAVQRTARGKYRIARTALVGWRKIGRRLYRRREPNPPPG